jgi:hypothetical protein
MAVVKIGAYLDAVVSVKHAPVFFMTYAAGRQRVEKEEMGMIHLGVASWGYFLLSGMIRTVVLSRL